MENDPLIPHFYAGLGVAILGGIGFIATDIAQRYGALNPHETSDAGMASIGFLCAGKTGMPLSNRRWH